MKNGGQDRLAQDDDGAGLCTVEDGRQAAGGVLGDADEDGVRELGE